jgi:hypothetical protein
MDESLGGYLGQHIGAEEAVALSQGLRRLAKRPSQHLTPRKLPHNWVILAIVKRLCSKFRWRETNDLIRNSTVKTAPLYRERVGSDA